MVPVVAFNLALLVVDVAWLSLVRQRSPWLRILFLAAYATCAFALALLVLWLAGGRVWTFTLVQLCAWAFFAHGPLLGVALSWLDGRSKTRSPWPASVFAFAIGAIAVWSFLVEPRRLEVTRTEVVAPRVTRPVRVAVVADIQTDAPGEFERRALLAVKAAEPDLVLFTGDYVQERVPNRYFRAVDELNAILREVDLDPPLGAYAVRGDVDAHRVELWGRVFRGTRVVAIGTTRRVVDPRLDEAGIELGALDCEDSRSTRLVLPPRVASRFRVLFGHAPDNAQGMHDADLVVAGHTHGGQVQLPFFGPLWVMSDVPLAVGGGGLHPRGHGGFLYVSRGIGMERGTAPRLRFFCRPEIALIDLVPGDPLVAVNESGSSPPDEATVILGADERRDG